MVMKSIATFGFPVILSCIYLIALLTMSPIVGEKHSCLWKFRHQMCLNTYLCQPCQLLESHPRFYFHKHNLPTTGVCHSLFPLEEESRTEEAPEEATDTEATSVGTSNMGNQQMNDTDTTIVDNARDDQNDARDYQNDARDGQNTINVKSPQRRRHGTRKMMNEHYNSRLAKKRQQQRTRARTRFDRLSPSLKENIITSYINKNRGFMHRLIHENKFSAEHGPPLAESIFATVLSKSLETHRGKKVVTAALAGKDVPIATAGATSKAAINKRLSGARSLRSGLKKVVGTPSARALSLIAPTPLQQVSLQHAIPEIVSTSPDLACNASNDDLSSFFDCNHGDNKENLATPTNIEKRLKCSVARRSDQKSILKTPMSSGRKSIYNRNPEENSPSSISSDVGGIVCLPCREEPGF
jgi:hypothetical protein